MAYIRFLMLLAVLGALSWFQFVNTASARDVGRDAVDLFDPRPGRDILFVGNSRMFTNEMPYMVRAVADSAGAPVKYRVRMWALPGATLADHSRNDALAALLARRWDRLVLQSESHAQTTAKGRAGFAAHGRDLVARAARTGTPSSLVVNWVYGEALFRGRPAGMRAGMHDLIQRDSRDLARATGAGLIDVGTVWRRVEDRRGDLALTIDGNHPSIHGTYLSALMVYGHLSGADVRAVRYAPDGIAETDARDLRALVAELLASGIDRPAR